MLEAVNGIAPDPRLPAVSTLLGPGAADALSAAFPGAGVHGLAVSRVDYRPGRRLAIEYQASVEWPDDRVSRERLAALADLDDQPQHSPTIECEGVSVAVWRVPDDPLLRGLRPATDPASVRQLLDELGAPPGHVTLKLRNYVAGRKALVEVGTPSKVGQVTFSPGQGLAAAKRQEALAYIKVVGPGQANDLQRKHDLLGERVAVPRCHPARTDLGLIVLEPLPGWNLWQQLQTWVGEPPGGAELVALLERFRDVDLGIPPTLTIPDKVEITAELLRAVVPNRTEDVDRIAAALGDYAPQPLITVHGDFHEQQVMVDTRGVTGLLDLDDAAPGHRVDDLARMAGRLWARARFRASDQIARYANQLIDSFATMCDPGELHRRIAATVFAYTTVPFRYQHKGWRDEIDRQLSLAESYLAAEGGPR